MIEPEHMIKTEEPVFLHGIYYHKLRLKSGRVVIGESPQSAQVAAWNAHIQLQMLLEQENGEIYEP